MTRWHRFAYCAELGLSVALDALGRGAESTSSWLYAQSGKAENRARVHHDTRFSRVDPHSPYEYRKA